MREYIATRDTNSDNASDEDRAMAHVTIFSGDLLSDAQIVLATYMRNEVDYLVNSDIRTPNLLRRAADILESIPAAKKLTPDEDKDWDKASLVSAGLVWAIVGITK